jgi:hypothetical protein
MVGRRQGIKVAVIVAGIARRIVTKITSLTLIQWLTNGKAANLAI